VYDRFAYSRKGASAGYDRVGFYNFAKAPARAFRSHRRERYQYTFMLTFAEDPRRVRGYAFIGTQQRPVQVNCYYFDVFTIIHVYLLLIKVLFYHYICVIIKAIDACNL